MQLSPHNAKTIGMAPHRSVTEDLAGEAGMLQAPRIMAAVAIALLAIRCYVSVMLEALLRAVPNQRGLHAWVSSCSVIMAAVGTRAERAFLGPGLPRRTVRLIE